ncbi:hypothetical protein FDA94_12255 [Herbidospora galbida]|uniref:Uncharacterized protein n=1 Tax=Herbidospora galbida TaxID=2575442 RepID=A0A4V5UZI5_9ACTN|nr:hypothetical protein [Herbidospora galbida]TKK88843.1 hypothetical protein FDA94_12255 [Herbidospora galbida]
MTSFKSAAAAFGVAVIALTTPALAADEPGKLTARLTITGSGTECRVLTVGKIGMTNAQARYLVDNGATARVEVWAEDAVFDNRVYKAPKATLSAISDRNGGGLFILSDLKLSCVNYLDEDDKPPYDYGDEIYTKIIFDGPGYPRMTKKSNVVHDNFGFGEP